jgi:hypothetical protein
MLSDAQLTVLLSELRPRTPSTFIVRAIEELNGRPAPSQQRSPVIREFCELTDDQMRVAAVDAAMEKLQIEMRYGRVEVRHGDELPEDA